MILIGHPADIETQAANDLLRECGLTYRFELGRTVVAPKLVCGARVTVVGRDAIVAEILRMHSECS